MLTLAAVVALAAVSHLVTRFNANQQARGRKLHALGAADLDAGNPERAIEELRAALTCDRSNTQYQLSLGRALEEMGPWTKPKRICSRCGSELQKTPRLIWRWPVWLPVVGLSTTRFGITTTRCMARGSPILRATAAMRASSWSNSCC